MQGIFVNYKRAPSKKAIKEAVTADPASVRIEATSFFGDEYDGSLSDMPDGTVTFVGPDPERSRKYFGTIVKRDGKIKVT